MSIRFLTLRLKKEIVILFYLILLISIKSQFVSNKRQKGSRSRLGEDQGRKENSRSWESTLNPRLGISVGSLPLGFRGFCKGGHRKLWDPVGMEDIEETVLQKQRTKAHRNLQRLWQLAQSLHSSKPDGIWSSMCVSCAFSLFVCLISFVLFFPLLSCWFSEEWETQRRDRIRYEGQW